LTMPSRVFVGQQDIMFHSLKTARRFQKRVPHAQVTVLPEAGHTLTDLADDILAFLRREEGAAKE